MNSVLEVVAYSFCGIVVFYVGTVLMSCFWWRK